MMFFLAMYHNLSCAQSLKYSFQTSDRLCLVTQYVKGGDVHFHLQRVGCFTEDHTRFYGAEITLGVQHLHRLGIIHRIISVGCFMSQLTQYLYILPQLENLMLDGRGHIKIIDFSLCKEGIYFGDTTRNPCGSLYYMAPEVGVVSLSLCNCH